MIVLSAFAIGVLTVGLRSVICYVFAGILIISAFAFAALASAGAVSLVSLAAALLFYNFGIASTIFAVMLAPRLRV